MFKTWLIVILLSDSFLHTSWGCHSTLKITKHILPVLMLSKTFVFFLRTSGEYLKVSFRLGSPTQVLRLVEKCIFFIYNKYMIFLRYMFSLSFNQILVPDFEGRVFLAFKSYDCTESPQNLMYKWFLLTNMKRI